MHRAVDQWRYGWYGSLSLPGVQYDPLHERPISASGEDKFNPVSFPGEFSEFERLVTSAVLAIQRPLQKIFENGQMLIERPVANS